MTDKKKSIDHLLQSLQERAKELNCIYRTEEILSNLETPLPEICLKIIDAIPPGWQYPEICQAKIVLENETYHKPDLQESQWFQSANILANEIIVGTITVYYTEEMPSEDDGPFLKEETKLIKTIAERLGHYVVHKKMRHIINDWETSTPKQQQWQVVLQMLNQTDRNLYYAIARKMLNHLCWSGIREAEEILQKYSPRDISDSIDQHDTWNQPLERRKIEMPAAFGTTVFDIAAKHFGDEDILNLIKKWVQEDKLSFLVQVVNRNLSLSDVADAIRRYYHLAEEERGFKTPNEIGIQVSLIRRFLSDQLEYINVIKHFIEISDFYHLLQKVIFSPESHGKLGGKSAGLYLASQILKKKKTEHKILNNVKIPKTWHITSDVLLHFMHYNNFEEVVEQKYKEINQVRLEYPHVVETFKRSTFPPDIARGLSMALDDFGETPLIVRSSSLLEDRVGAAFSGKYKSLFLANMGSKEERLEALMDAIAEVYASTFGPDPIEYRAERGLIDFGEEMGIIIQEVVGQKIGDYYLPAFAGVAFSKNEYRWSPRIRREDGLVRMVPGLGTRAVDRLSDDYPVLLAPGQPGLKVNIEPDEIYRYSPKKLDVINLISKRFETVNLNEFLDKVGDKFPILNKICSTYKDGRIVQSFGLGISEDSGEYVVTFDGLFRDTDFVNEAKIILDILEETYGHPVDIEFAHDGKDIYLLQCRSQSYSRESLPAPIPKDIAKDKIIFSANKHISNGRIPDITQLVYIDPEAYSSLENRNEMLAVGRAVGKLNKILPKRQFVLMGPGRWGSRGDIRLGVSVTYSDINNTAVLIEIARKKGNYIPDLSFGTHFFQDLVEAQIRYIPLYPDDEEILFNEVFFRKSENILIEVLPEFAYLDKTIKLIDIQKNSGGNILKILMNADLDEAIGILTKPSVDIHQSVDTKTYQQEPRGEFWRWRHSMVERLAQEIDSKRFGVVDFYIFGSTKNATAGPNSDIDIMVHFRGDTHQLNALNLWLEGWSKCLAEINYMRTGYRSDGLLDIHIITDEDIEKKSSFAAKIGAITDPAHKLSVGRKSK
jgi:pyruvate, water dikinase